MNPPDC